MSKTDLSSYNNDWYKPLIGASRLKQLCWYFCNVLIIKNGWNPASGIKVAVLRLFGARIGKGVLIKPGVNIKYPWKLTIGDHCWIGEEVWIDNLAQVTIGNHVCISQGAMLLTGNHHYGKPGFDLIVKEIQLHDGVWIGAKALVCPGIVCESHAVLAALSVANSNLAAYGIYQGNPAQPVRQRMIAAQ